MIFNTLLINEIAKEQELQILLKKFLVIVKKRMYDTSRNRNPSTMQRKVIVTSVSSETARIYKKVENKNILDKLTTFSSVISFVSELLKTYPTI